MIASYYRSDQSRYTSNLTNTTA